MRLDDQRQLVVGWPNGAAGVDPGDRLLRVNGHDANALLETYAREVSNDTEAGRLAEVARRFRVYLALHGINAPYEVTVAAPDGRSRDVTIRGEPVNYLLDPVRQKRSPGRRRRRAIQAMRRLRTSTARPSTPRGAHASSRRRLSCRPLSSTPHAPTWHRVHGVLYSAR
jgi:hypothetical protein